MIRDFDARAVRPVRDTSPQPGMRLRLVSIHQEGFEYAENIVWVVLSVQPAGPAVRIEPGSKLTPHTHVMPWSQRVLVLPPSAPAEKEKH